MDRRSFLKTSTLGGSAVAATALAAPAYAQGKRTLTMVTSWPRGFAVLDDASEDSYFGVFSIIYIVNIKKFTFTFRAFFPLKI